MGTMMKSCGLGGIAVLALTFVTAGEDKPARKTQDPPGLERLKALSGEWNAVPLDEKEGHSGKVIYKVTAGGSAVAETLFPGSDHEMLTVYHGENGDLVMTHYCMLGNQPRMKANPKLEANRLRFEFAGGANLDPKKDKHMHAATLTFVDPDHIEIEGVAWENGAPSKEMCTTMKLVRQK